MWGKTNSHAPYKEDFNVFYFLHFTFNGAKDSMDADTPTR